MTSADFFRPTSTEEACSLLECYGAEASVLAGGTDLMVAVNRAQRSLEVDGIGGGVERGDLDRDVGAGDRTESVCHERRDR